MLRLWPFIWPAPHLLPNERICYMNNNTKIIITFSILKRPNSKQSNSDLKLNLSSSGVIRTPCKVYVKSTGILSKPKMVKEFMKCAYGSIYLDWYTIKIFFKNIRWQTSNFPCSTTTAKCESLNGTHKCDVCTSKNRAYGQRQFGINSVIKLKLFRFDQ